MTRMSQAPHKSNNVSLGGAGSLCKSVAGFALRPGCLHTAAAVTHPAPRFA
jgi:hypothetical protein